MKSGIKKLIINQRALDLTFKNLETSMHILDFENYHTLTV